MRLFLYELHKIKILRNWVAMLAVFLAVNAGILTWMTVSHRAAFADAVTVAEKLGTVIDEDFKREYFQLCTVPELKKAHTVIGGLTYFKVFNEIPDYSSYEAFTENFERLTADPLFVVQADENTRSLVKQINGILNEYRRCVYSSEETYLPLLSENGSVSQRAEAVLENGEYLTYMPSNRSTNFWGDISLLKTVLFWECVLAAFITVFLFSEAENETEGSCYTLLLAAKRRNTLLPIKYAAGLVSFVLLAAVLQAVSWTAYFSLFDYSKFLDCFVSNPFFFDSASEIPVLSAGALTLRGLLTAHIGFYNLILPGLYTLFFLISLAGGGHNAWSLTALVGVICTVVFSAVAKSTGMGLVLCSIFPWYTVTFENGFLFLSGSNAFSEKALLHAAAWIFCAAWTLVLLLSAVLVLIKNGRKQFRVFM